MKRAWLSNRDWEYVVSVNEALCQSGRAPHKPTSDGYEETKTFWLENYRRELTLAEAVEICRRCHRMAPFCNFNGNTFVAIIRDCLSRAPGLDARQIALVIGDAETVAEKILRVNQDLGGLARLNFQMTVAALPHDKMTRARVFR